MAPYRLDLKPSPADHPLRRVAHLVKGTRTPLPPASAWESGWLLGILDQGNEGSCTGNGGEGFREVLHGSAFRHPLPYRLSRKYLYAKTRIREGTFPQDSGCTVADTMSVLHLDGICREEVMPYDEDPAGEPTPGAEVDAKLHRIGQPLEVACTQLAIKTVLAAGMPILIGMSVGWSFISGNSGTKPGELIIPPPDEKPEGGHCTFLVGYNEWGMMGVNSWGTSWGDHGFYYLPWGYENLFWEAWSASPVA